LTVKRGYEIIIKTLFLSIVECGKRSGNVPTSTKEICEKDRNNNLLIIKFCIVILTALILLTSCVSNVRPETTYDMVATSSQVPTSATPSTSVTVPESTTVIKSSTEPDLSKYSLPDGFVYVTDVIPTAQLEVRYFSNDNFTGAVIDGYEAPKAILTKEAAEALKIAADTLYEQGYYIKFLMLIALKGLLTILCAGHRSWMIQK